MKRELVKIVPPKAGKFGLVKTSGTKVMIGQVELPNVIKIVLKAEVDSIWEAEIHCHVRMQPMDALAVIHYPKPWWRRALKWIAGGDK